MPVNIDPSDGNLVIVLSSEEKEQAQCQMKLTYEAGDSMALSPGTALAFKIKTTKPKRYIVKPNQGIIPANSSESISIIVVETERQILMDEWVSSGIADTTNKFLVQCVPVDASFVEIVQGESSKEKLEKYSELWSSSQEQDGLEQHKLVMKFEYKDAAGGSPTIDGTETLKKNPLRKSLDSVKESIQYGLTRRRGSLSRSQNGASDSDDRGSTKDTWKEVRELRSKYNELVAFSITLKAEKDVLQRDLEATEAALRDEKIQRSQLSAQLAELENPGAKIGGGPDKGGKEGFNLLHIMLAAILFFFIGRFLEI